MKFSSAIVEVVVDLVRLKEKNAIQVETEKAKLRQMGTSERLDLLLAGKNDFADVRLKCITSLLTLYGHHDLINKLELFTNKFKDRLVSMVMDSDTEVAIKSCQLMTFIYRAFPNLLELKDCVPMYEIVYCTNRALALAAGEFLNTKVFTQANSQYDPQVAHLNVQESRQLLFDLVTFFIEGEVHNHAAFLVDALIDINPMLKDWPTMVDMLLNDDSDRYDTELIEIMCCAVKQAATGENPIGRTNPKRGPVASTKDARYLVEERARISEVFIPAPPKLLARFIADQAKISNLTSIPVFFQMEMYPNARLGLHLEEMMLMLDRIVEQHADDEILRNVAKIIQHFATNVAVAQQTEPARLRLVDGVALQLRQGMQRFVEEEEDRLDEEDEASLLASYRKMTALFAAIDIRKWDIWDMTLNLLNNSHKFQSADLAEKGVLLLYQNLVWELKHVALHQDFNEEGIRKLKKRRDQFLMCTQVILGDGAAGVENVIFNNTYTI
uniref:Cohesin subunit SCC3/SA HEAT-repeats domain-containing protein n=1 Tax=Ditylenchus dipsaci TaxID=166011 RepID=A0A915DTA0_9BILA